MPLWALEFFPESGARSSPLDFLESYCTPNELARILAKLDGLRQLSMPEWPYNWAKPIEGLYELKSGDFRIFHKPVNKTIVVCHACRKKGRKANPQDIKAAQDNLASYLREHQHD